MSKTKRQKERRREGAERAREDAAEAREAFRRADAWARSPEGQSYATVLETLSAKAEK
jgi:hypothetical protein